MKTLFTKRQVADFFRKGAKSLEEGTWIRLSFGDLSSNCGCMMGHVAKVCPPAKVDDPVSRLFGCEAGGFNPDCNLRALGVGKYLWMSDLYTYNDAPGRTKKEVVSMMRTIAYALEHGGKDRNGNKLVEFIK